MYVWIKKIWTKSLSRQLMLGIALVHAVLMTIFVFDLVNRQRGFLTEQSRKQAIGLAETLATSGSSWVLANDFIGMEEVILSQSGFPGLKYAIFMDLNNRVLGYTERDKVGKYASDLISQRLNKAPSEVHILVNDAFLIDVAAPIFAGDQQIGWARVGISREGIADNLEIVTRDGLLYTLLAIVVGIIFAWFMAQGLSSAIRQITSKAHAVGQGEREIDFKLDRQDELGILGQDLDSTLNILIQNENELKKYQDDLERLVELRTHELKVANDELRAYSIKIEQDKDKLVEAEKMASMGSLVAGISHEINTPVGLSLTGITHIQEQLDTIIRKLETKTLKQSTLEKFLDDVKLMAESMRISLSDAASLIRSFKQVAVDQHGEQQRRFNLSDYVDDVLLSLRSETKHSQLSIEKAIRPDLILTSYPGVFSQIITNLITNSLKHAFEAGEDGMIKITAAIENEQLLFTYEDNGKGMDDEVVKRIFDPFFTTKMGQGGSGLGMHVIYNLVTQKMDGEISCSSQLDVGTKFVIHIPL